ncbi:hypothetical protein AB0758_45590 [Tolypothrix bouteillei VB521301_2]
MLPSSVGFPQTDLIPMPNVLRKQPSGSRLGLFWEIPIFIRSSTRVG